MGHKLYFISWWLVIRMFISWWLVIGYFISWWLVIGKFISWWWRFWSGIPWPYGYDQRFRKLKPKPKLNPPNAHRSQIKICENRQTQNVQFRLMPNAFRILKPIQKSSKRVWVFRNTGANAFAKNQMRLAYEDKRDLYCMGGGMQRVQRTFHGYYVHCS